VVTDEELFCGWLSFIMSTGREGGNWSLEVICKLTPNGYVVAACMPTLSKTSTQTIIFFRQYLLMKTLLQ